MITTYRKNSALKAMKITLIQLNTGGDKAANLKQIETLVEDAVAQDRPDLVALPEVITYLGENRENRRAAAETLPDGEGYRLLQGLASKHGIYLHGGSLIEKADGERLYNTTVAFGPDGTELARYRKIHLFDVTTPDGKEYRESNTFGRGENIVTYDADGISIGCSICYDLRFPELYQALAKKGAQVIMVPSAFTLMTGKDHWEVLLRARAIETQCYVIAPGQWGRYAEDASRVSYGHSLVVDPWGHVIAQAHDKVGFVTATLDMAYLDSIRAKIPVAQHKVL